MASKFNYSFKIKVLIYNVTRMTNLFLKWINNQYVHDLKFLWYFLVVYSVPLKDESLVNLLKKVKEVSQASLWGPNSYMNKKSAEPKRKSTIKVESYCLWMTGEKVNKHDPLLHYWERNKEQFFHNCNHYKQT